MTFSTIVILMGLKYIQTSIPQWRKDVDKWVQEDKEGFMKFKKEVFTVINLSKKNSKADGFEIIHPKKIV